MKHYGYENKGNDRQLKLLIVKQILHVSTIGNIWRKVWRICILIHECEEFTNRAPHHPSSEPGNVRSDRRNKQQNRPPNKTGNLLTTRRSTYRTDHLPNQINYCQSNKTSSVPNVWRTNQRIDRPTNRKRPNRAANQATSPPPGDCTTRHVSNRPLNESSSVIDVRKDKKRSYSVKQPNVQRASAPTNRRTEQRADCQTNHLNDCNFKFFFRAIIHFEKSTIKIYKTHVVSDHLDRQLPWNEWLHKIVRTPSTDSSWKAKES